MDIYICIHVIFNSLIYMYKGLMPPIGVSANTLRSYRYVDARGEISVVIEIKWRDYGELLLEIVLYVISYISKK